MESKDIIESDNLQPEIIDEQPVIADVSQIWGDLFTGETTGNSSTGNTTGESSTGNTTEDSSTGNTTETVSDEDVGVDLMGAMTMLNFGVGFAVPLVANLFGKEIDGSKILASDTQLKKLAKAGKPLYEKYLQNKMSAETAFVICLVSVYGGKILAEIKDKPKQKTQKTENKEETNEEKPFWLGNPDYFQTGQKKGTLKPKR